MASKKVLFEGSSKRFYENSPTSFLMNFKDDIHGNNRASIIQQTGTLRKEFTYYFYRYLEKHGVPTHLFGKDSKALTADGIIVQKCLPIRLEVLYRRVARGHWVDEHKIPLFEGGTRFDQPIVEFCLKIKKTLDNGSTIDDPRINPSLAVELNKHAKDPAVRGHMLLNVDEAEHLEQMALKIGSLYEQFLKQHGWDLEDFKFEVGVSADKGAGKGIRPFILIDEISPDSSRVRDSQGNSLTKDLFRQKRPEKDIVACYALLAEAIKKEAP